MNGTWIGDNEPFPASPAAVHLPPIEWHLHHDRNGRTRSFKPLHVLKQLSGSLEDMKRERREEHQRLARGSLQQLTCGKTYVENATAGSDRVREAEAEQHHRKAWQSPGDRQRSIQKDRLRPGLLRPLSASLNKYRRNQDLPIVEDGSPPNVQRTCNWSDAENSSQRPEAS